MSVFRSVAGVRTAVSGWRREGHRVGLVPTMGALHEGHLSLIRAASRSCGRVAVSIFVNPKQFGPNEDFEKYPRQEPFDIEKAIGAGAHGIFVPTVAEMYPDGYNTVIAVPDISSLLCGMFRPGHFDGVATVVSKLLLQAQPDVAVFGEKDYQQLQLIRRMVRDLDIPVRIEGGTTVREADGLAMSSRNAYLSAEQRQVAPVIHQTLQGICRRLESEPDAVQEAVSDGVNRLTASGFAKIDYLAVCDAESLRSIDRVTGPARVLVAAFLGGTRLIDNLPIAARSAP
jgi:pantoate--beta-alanine ligase